MKKCMDEILEKKNVQPMEVITEDTDRDFFLTSEEAVQYGLIDRIVRAGEGVIM